MLQDYFYVASVRTGQFAVVKYLVEHSADINLSPPASTVGSVGRDAHSPRHRDGRKSHLDSGVPEVHGRVDVARSPDADESELGSAEATRVRSSSLRPEELKQLPPGLVQLFRYSLRRNGTD